MKIEDLVEYKFPKIQYRTTPKPPDAYYDEFDPTKKDFRADFPKLMKRNADVEHLGSGTYSSAYYNPKKTPHEVRKVSKALTDREIDGFFYYIKELSESDKNTNPYFPRFSAIKVYTKPRGKQGKKTVYSVQMEKLYSVQKALGSIHSEETQALYERIFGTEHGREMIKQFVIDDVVEFVIRGRTDEFKYPVVDEQLIEAGEFIREIQLKHKIDLDVQMSNIMIRKTPYGTQLVITDPLA